MLQINFGLGEEVMDSCALWQGNFWGWGCKNRGPDSFPYSPRQELPLGAFPDPKLSLDASLQLLGILVTTLNLFSVTVNVSKLPQLRCHVSCPRLPGTAALCSESASQGQWEYSGPTTQCPHDLYPAWVSLSPRVCKAEAGS